MASSRVDPLMPWISLSSLSPASRLPRRAFVHDGVRRIVGRRRLRRRRRRSRTCGGDGDADGGWPPRRHCRRPRRCRRRSPRRRRSRLSSSLGLLASALRPSESSSDRIVAVLLATSAATATAAAAAAAGRRPVGPGRRRSPDRYRRCRRRHHRRRRRRLTSTPDRLRRHEQRQVSATLGVSWAPVSTALQADGLGLVARRRDRLGQSAAAAVRACVTPARRLSASAGERFAHPLGIVVLDRGVRAARPTVEFGQRIEHPLAGGSQHACQRMDPQLRRRASSSRWVSSDSSWVGASSATYSPQAPGRVVSDAATRGLPLLARVPSPELVMVSPRAVPCGTVSVPG